MTYLSFLAKGSDPEPRRLFEGLNGRIPDLTEAVPGASTLVLMPRKPDHIQPGHLQRCHEHTHSRIEFFTYPSHI